MHYGYFVSCHIITFPLVGDNECLNHNLSSNIDLVNSAFDLLTSNSEKCAYHNNFDVFSSNSKLKDSLSIIHLNVRSLQKNFDAFYEFLCNQPSSPDIICVTETRLKTQPSLNIDISGYTFVHIDSPTTAGGVAMYISNALQFSVLNNLQLTVNECENIWIKLHDSNLIISTIYRHPKNDALVFIDALNTNLEKVRSNKVFLVGDFNLNIKSLPDLRFPDRHASEYLDMLISNGYYPLINVPTGVTDNSSTIIDHIITNDHTHNISSGVIKTDLTDHFPIFCTISNVTLKNLTNRFIGVILVGLMRTTFAIT